jgi:uncharacterized protein HemX
MSFIEPDFEEERRPRPPARRNAKVAAGAAFGGAGIAVFWAVMVVLGIGLGLCVLFVKLIGGIA